MKSKIEKLFINISIYIIIFFIIYGISMLVIINNMESSDENFPYGAFTIGEEKTIVYSFLKIPMREEGIVIRDDGSFDIRTTNYLTHTLAPVIISFIFSTVIFYIITSIRKRKNPKKHDKKDKFLFEWTFKD